VSGEQTPSPVLAARNAPYTDRAGDRTDRRRRHRTVAEPWHDGNLTLVGEHVAADFVGHLLEDGRELHGWDSYGPGVEKTAKTFPDFQLTFDPVFASEEFVCARRTFGGVDARIRRPIGRRGRDRRGANDFTR
jgi:predicted ester cyclase